MKKLLVIFLALYSFTSFSQEGTKQLMPNEGDRLWLEINCPGYEYGTNKDFATYNADKTDRLHIYLKEGETMHFGMKMNRKRYTGGVSTYPPYVDFRIKAPDGNVVYGEREMFTSGDVGYINTYEEAVNGPNGVILNKTEITGGYNSETLTASQTGNYYIEFDHDDDDRFAIEYFDVTVTHNDTVVTNPGEPNKSAGRLWSNNWQLTNTSFTEHPVKVYFYVFTSDEFVNKIQYLMKPYSFNFVSNDFGVDNSSSLNVIEQAQSRDGHWVGSEDIAEYKIYLNDPDRNVWKTTALPPPKIKVWHEEKLIYDYDYMRDPMEKEIELDTLVFEKNNPGSGCDYSNSSLTLFEIETNVAGFTTILLDIDGGGYSTGGNDRVLHRELKKGRNYILWNFRNDNGEIVSNGDVSISATFFGRGATNFPLYDVETLSEVSTKTKRPFNKLCPTLYWDDSKISDWGDDSESDAMSGTDTTQLVYGNQDLPRVWSLGDYNDQHNGNMNTMNTWYNAIDLGRGDIKAEVITSDTLCINGDRPVIADIQVDTTKNNTLSFDESDFTDKFSEASGDNLESVRIVSLPPSGKGTLRLNGSSVTAGQIINRGDLNNLTFDPATDETGNAFFLWNATDGTYYAEEPDTVNVFINTPPDISHIRDTSICTDENLEVDFTVSDQDDGHDPEDIDVIAYSNNLNVVPNSGIEVTGTGKNRTLTVEPFGIQSGYTIIYLQAYDGVTSIIEQFAIKMTPSLEFTGDTSVCAGSKLELTAVEIGADSYTWEREGTVVESDSRTYTDPELTEDETGTYTLTIVKDGCVSSRDFTVSIYPVVTFTGDTDLCVGEDLKLSADEEIAEDYKWKRGDSPLASSKQLIRNDVNADLTGDNYTLFVRKEGCENTSDPFSISVKKPAQNDLEIAGDTVEIGEDATVTIIGSENDMLYRAYKDDEELASATGTGDDTELPVSSEYLDVGENTIKLTADNGNCEVDMLSTATVFVNTVPQAVNDNVTFNENNTITLNVLENDSGLEDGELNLQITNPPYNGDAGSNSQDSTITYKPEQDYFGRDSLVYTVYDAQNDCDSAYVFFNIEYVNDSPTAKDDYITMDEDSDAIIDVLANDYDLDSGLTVTVTSGPGNGYADINTDNTVSYEPEPDFYGNDTLIYKVEDAEGDSDEATVYITIENVDDQPVANDDVATTDEDNPVEIFVLENDEGLGDGVADVKIINAPTNGTVTVNTYNEDFPVTYEPDPDYNGDDWFEYKVVDEDGDSDVARVDVTVNPVSDPVTANDDYASLEEDTNVDINVLDNDEVPDGVQRLDISTSAAHGDVTILSDNEINYAPDEHYYGEDSFVYEVVDDHGDDNDFATVHITVDSLPDNVVAINDAVTLDEDTNTDIAVLENDDVPDGVKSIDITTQPTNGTVTILSNSEINYEPNADYNGDDNFAYEVTDNFDNTDDATVSITVEPVDDEVTANDDDVTLDEDTNIDIPVTDNDDIPDDVESITIISTPGDGYAEVNDDNTIYYEPDQDYYGEDNFVYEVVDAHGADSDQATVNITIEWVNDVPVANNDNASTGALEAVTVNVLENDASLGDGIYSLSIYSGPESGSATTNLEDSTITYEPDPNTLRDTLEYEIQDSLDQNGENFGEIARAELIISVGDTNYIPIANNDNVTIDEDNDTEINVLANDENLYDGVDYVEIVEEPDNGVTDVNNDNTVNYSPDEHYNGADSFEYAVFDNDGDSDTAIVQIDIDPVNDIPDAVNDYITMDEDTVTTVNVLQNDNGLGDGVDNLEISSFSAKGSVEVVSDSTISYEPEADYYGFDEFDYTVTDVDGESSTATVHITVENVNDIPEAENDSVTMDEDTDTKVNVLQNDNGLGDGVNNLEISSVSAKGSAEVVGDSTISYEPEADYYGSDEFDYTVTDVDGESSTATVHITVENVNDIPDAVNDTIETDEDVPLTFNLLKNDNGLGDGGLSIDIIESSKNGSIEFTGNTGDSTITYTPEADYYGEDSLVYEVRDVDNETSTAKVYITIHPVNDHQPVANDDERGTEMNTSVNVDVLFNDTGLEDGGIYLQIDDANEPEHGNVVVTGSNTLNYTPETDYLGEDEFVYQVYDYDDDVSSARVTIHVVENNNVPIANDDNVSTHKNTPLFIDVLKNDTNLDDGGIEVVEWLSPEYGTIESIDSGYVKYVPDNNYVGNDRFVYKVNDAEGDYDMASVYLTVTDDDNILPVANPDSVTTPEDTEVTSDVLSNDGNLDDGIYTLTISETPENGKVTNTEINGEQGNITYNPDNDYYGLDSLVYQVCDLNNDCDEAKMIIDIQAVNDYQPVAVDDSSGTSINTSVGVNVLMNDTGLGDGGIELSGYNAPTNGSVTEIINNEIVEYAPEADYLGYDYFDYQISDYDGDTDTANVKITVRENNLVPVANPDTATTSKGTPIEIDVLDNDVAGDESMADMKVTQFIEPENGSVSITEDSLITYTPDSSFSVGIDTFWYKVDDIDGDWDTARVSVVVYDGYNHKPAAFDDYRSLDEDASPVFIDVLENDTALQDKPIKLSIQSEPLYGTVTELVGDSAMYYEPSPDYFGADSLTYKIRDVNGDWDIANVHLQVNPVDDGIPYAKDDSAGTSVNTPVDVNILMNDENLEDSITLSIISNPENGSVEINEDSTVTYTPESDYLGRDVFEYRITDYDDQSDKAKVIIEVRKNNIEPVAIPDSARTVMNQKISIHVLRNDSLLDDGVGQVTLFERPSHGRAIVKQGNYLEYDPEKDYIGIDQLEYKVDDEDGDWDTASVHVTIDSIPKSIPDANDDYQATEMNKPVEVDVLANDKGLDDTPINVWIIDQPVNGDAEVPNGSNNIYYEPEPDYLGKDTLQYAVFDNDDDSDTAKVIIHVKESNLIPVAIDDSAHTFMNHEVEIHVLNNDSLLQDGLDSIEIFSQADHGELQITQYNTVVYNPYKWYSGNDEFEYLVKDVDGDYDVATVAITVEQIPNYVPDAQNDSTGTSINEAVTVDVLRNDEGLKDKPINLSQISTPDYGDITINTDKTITYAPEKDYIGYDYFDYKVCDYDDECDSATVKIHVRENNTNPVAMEDKIYTYMNEDTTINVLENDYGLDDGMGDVTIARGPSYGEATVNDDYTISYSPNYWFSGSDTLVYELTDIDGDYDTAVVAIGVLDTPENLPEVYISETKLVTSENLTKAHFSMALQTPPSSNVHINMRSSDITEGRISDDKISFTTENWDREQIITVTGEDDNIVDGNIQYKIMTDNAVSDDPVYNNLSVENLDIINKDNDEPGIEVSLLSEDNRTSEDGDRVKLGLLLVSRPTSDVFIDMASTDNTEGVVENNQVVFAPSDSIQEKEVLITGVDDTERDGDIDYEVEFNVSGQDTSYKDIEIENFQLVNEDNDEIESFIPDAFSPNNDDFNDRFVIKGLEQYDNLSIKIYNRWGSLVYSNNDYKNNWDGKANVSTLGKKKLPSSTYYYYLKIKDTGETIEGSVYLKR